MSMTYDRTPSLRERAYLEKELDDTAFQAVARLTEQVKQVSARVCSLADRLVGPSPGDEALPDNSVISGLLQAVEDRCSQSASALDRAHLALARIEQALR